MLGYSKRTVPGIDGGGLDSLRQIVMEEEQSLTYSNGATYSVRHAAMEEKNSPGPQADGAEKETPPAAYGCWRNVHSTCDNQANGLSGKMCITMKKRKAFERNNSGRLNMISSDIHMME